MSQDTDEYLEAVLDDQTLSRDSDELKALRERGNDVKKLLRDRFSQESPSVRNAGSFEKRTMVRVSYDLDILCYFPHETDAGDNLEEIYNAVADVLQEEYLLSRKRSALKLLDPTEPEDPEYFHIDVVPGRFMEDDGDGDVALYQESSDDHWLKTNPEKQIETVRKSGLRPAIKLAKIWRERYGFSLATFVLELIVLDLLEARKDDSLSDQMEHLWEELREHVQDITVEDPANSNNDLDDILDAAARANLLNAAEWALNKVENDSWDEIFGEVDTRSKEEKAAALKRAAASISSEKSPRSYCVDER